MSQAVIDELEVRLRQLDQQHAWLERMIDDINDLTTPRANRRGVQIPFGGPVGVEDDDISDVSDDDADIDPFYLPPEEEEGDPYESDEWDDDHSVETIIYHTEAWGFYPHGVDTGYESDDCSTICGEWEDPFMSPIQRLAPVAAAYYNNHP